MGNLETFFKQFEEWILWDIRYLLKLEDENGIRLDPDRTTNKYKRRPFVASAILICCAIDVLAAFRYGKRRNDAGKTFKSFLKNYFVETETKSMKSYNAEYIYDGLRNALLHGYSLGKYLALSHDEESKHLNKIGSRTLIDVFMFYYDLELVYQKYKQELKNGKHGVEFNNRWNFAKLIQYIPEENLKR